MLIGNALAANQSHALATYGLAGSKAVHYGPVPVWFYQALLTLSHHLPTLVTLRTLFFVIVCLLAARSLARSVGFRPIVVIIAMVSPYFFISARQLWDNTLILPVGLLTFACYARFLKSYSRAALGLTIVGTGTLMLIHPMSIALVAAIALHALFAHGRRVARAWPIVLLSCGVMLLLSWGYLNYALRETPRDLTGATGHDGWWFPLTAIRLTGAAHFGYFFEEVWPSVRPAGWGFIAFMSMFAIIPFLRGIISALIQMGRQSSHLSPDASLARVAILALIFQIPAYGLSCTYGHPHHLNPLWAPTIILTAFGLSRMNWPLFRRVILTGWLIGNLMATAWLLRYLVQHPATPTQRIGITLAEQQRIIDQLLSLPRGTRIETDIPQFRQYPQSIGVQRVLSGIGLSDPASNDVLHVHFDPSSPTLSINHE